jgi:hypothetical protein
MEYMSKKEGYLIADIMKKAYRLREKLVPIFKPVFLQVQVDSSNTQRQLNDKHNDCFKLRDSWAVGNGDYCSR